MEEIEQFFKERQGLGIKPGLERMHLLLDKLNHPEEKMRAIHVAGTNGKGSTVQMVANALVANNYTVGIFSSPSFTGLTGHFLINNQAIREWELIELMNEVIPVVEQLDAIDEAPTEFEILTALAFLYFAERVDLALIEAGMGGRSDTTNCVMPLISVITSVAYDHEQFLGKTLEEIASEKAGIIKEGRPVIVGPLSERAQTVIDKEARANLAPLYADGTHFTAIRKRKGFTWKSNSGRTLPITLALLGEHQVDNAALALKTLEILTEISTYSLNWEHVMAAIEQVRLPGRFEQVSTTPQIIVDSAHNLAGIEAFIKTAKEETNLAETNLLFAGFRDKRIDEMVGRLIEAGFSVKVTTFNHERAAQKIDFHKILTDEAATYSSDWQAEIRRFLQASPPNKTLYITGSLHFVMQVRHFIKQLVTG